MPGSVMTDREFIHWVASAPLEELQRQQGPYEDGAKWKHLTLQLEIARRIIETAKRRRDDRE